MTATAAGRRIRGLRKRGGLRELRNNIKVLKRQQAAKAAAERAAAEAETSGLTESETAPVRVDSSATGPSMSGAANDAYDTPMSGGSGSGRPRSARSRLDFALGLDRAGIRTDDRRVWRPAPRAREYRGAPRPR